MRRFWERTVGPRPTDGSCLRASQHGRRGAWGPASGQAGGGRGAEPLHLRARGHRSGGADLDGKNRNEGNGIELKRMELWNQLDRRSGLSFSTLPNRAEGSVPASIRLFCEY